MPGILPGVRVNAPIAKVCEALIASQGISSRRTPKVTTTAEVGSEVEMGKNDTLIMKLRIEDLGWKKVVQ